MGSCKSKPKPAARSVLCRPPSDEKLVNNRKLQDSAAVDICVPRITQTQLNSIQTVEPEAFSTTRHSSINLYEEKPPPLPPPKLESTSPSSSSQLNEEWSALFCRLAPRILDPQDLPSTLDAIISKTTNNLSPVEISFIRKRVRRCSRMSSNTNTCNNSNNSTDERESSSSIATALAVSGGGAGDKGERMSRSSSLSGKVGRLVSSGFGAVSSTTFTNGDKFISSGGNCNNYGSNHINSSHHYHYQCHPALEEATSSSKMSKATLQNERLLDLHMVRKIFEAGEKTLRSLQAHIRVEAASSFSEIKLEIGSGSGLSLVPPPATTGKGYSPLIRTFSKLGSGGSIENQNHQSNCNNYYSIDRDSIEISALKTINESDREIVEKIDICASAFLLLIYMSEVRWDYVTEIAKCSAKRANLITDVNQLALLDNQKDEERASHSLTISGAGDTIEVKNESNSSTSNDHNNHFSKNEPSCQQFQHHQTNIPSPPFSPSFMPPSHMYNLPELTCTEPAGVHFSSICYIIGMALRGSRRQKLTLLFFLLLPPKDLDALLASHPAGGLPTWLLEIDEEVILTFDSLSYYYHYEGVMMPLYETRSFDSDCGSGVVTGENTITGINSSNEVDGNCSRYRKRLTIDARVAVEVLAALLIDSIVGSSWSSSLSFADFGKKRFEEKEEGIRGYSYGIRRLIELTTSENENSTLTKNQGVNDMLDAALEGESFHNLGVNEIDLIKRFIEASADIADSSSSTTSSNRLLWSMVDFVEWANASLDDLLLGSIMRHIFSRGILPCANIEREIISQRWIDWNTKDVDDAISSKNVSEVSSPSRGGFRSLFSALKSENEQEGKTSTVANTYNRVWGGIGGFDGKGGLGHGVLYCIDKQWWDDWVAYTGWQFGISGHSVQKTLTRPRELSTERLLDQSLESQIVAGTRGSYELMRSNIIRDIDYTLIPPGVWNALYELYGGGPPLPRMVLPPETSETQSTGESVSEASIESISSNSQHQQFSMNNYPTEIPASICIATHPWIIHCQICDPQQPYRRGDAGPISIRVMAMPEQPLWRLFSEIVLRLPIFHSKARDSHGEGRARLWRFEVPYGKTPSTSSRYGPWVLLCKNRVAEIPTNSTTNDKYEERWKIYGDQHSVESIGLSDGIRVMYEYAIVGKDGSFSWPREAAAKATRLRRIADEDAVFRCNLRGLDKEGMPLRGSILRKSVDVLDSSGRWYQAIIVNLDRTTTPLDDNEANSDEQNDNASSLGNISDAEFKQNTFVRVRFNDHTGNSYEEWIDVNSDRLAVGGRFTADSVRSIENGDDFSNVTTNEIKSRLSGIKKKDPSDSVLNDVSSNSMCLFPSYGACGLVNLGNTCYANSGWQCMSYLPLLRSYLLSEQYRINGDLNKDNPLGTGGNLLLKFGELMQLMWSGKFGSREPFKFRVFLGKCRPQYSGADQQDAQELINDMFDMLHEDGNRVKTKPYVEALEDKFIQKSDLPRVGLETWRRFLRRNRSAISDLTMGQAYNRVTCPICNHSSKNFDPFNMLSLPFPSVAEVIFQCTVVRRATIDNCPSTLLLVGQNRKDETLRTNGSVSPPSKSLIFEQYVIPMSRLADIGDLKMKLQNVTGIPSNRFRICRSDEITTGIVDDENDASHTYVKVSALPDKAGPCVKLLQQGSMDDVTSPMIAKIIAFEATLSPRPLVQTESNASMIDDSYGMQVGNDDASTVEDLSDDSSSTNGISRKKVLEQIAYQCLTFYGDDKECVLYDTNPNQLSEYVSHTLWPKSAADFTVGLRLDAIDQRNHWCPGTVIEIIEGNDNFVNGDEGAGESQRKVKVHFDNYIPKWDEVYTIDSFTNGRVFPLYSHATPRSKPTEFLVHHRVMDRKSKKFYLFGQSFYLQFHTEWSTARAGAHLIAQTSRFLETSQLKLLENGTNIEQNKNSSKIRPKEKHETFEMIALIIELLIKSDQTYIQCAIDSGKESARNKSHAPFDGIKMSKIFNKKLNDLLSLLPFEIRVTYADTLLGNKEETPFLFLLTRTIGNYMNSKNSLVLHWHSRSDRSFVQKPLESCRQILYTSPTIVAHELSHSLLKSNNDTMSKTQGSQSLKRHPSTSHGGIHIGVCLAEFCKEQNLDAVDCWRCPVCKVDREGKQSMVLWKLPDILTFHLKRFNASSRWREKITTKVDFPLTGLNMREWCDKESPLCKDADNESFIYDLIGVVNHHGGMTGGHYVAMCKATACSPDGNEDVAYSFNGLGTTEFDAIEEEAAPSGWRLGRSKEKESSSNLISKAVAESAEPLWLQFDDDLVEPVPPRNVVSETAYVLFYRRRRMHPANIAKYSSLE